MLKVSKQEIQYLMNAVDAVVRAKGLQSAGIGLVLATKLQNEATALDKAEAEGKPTAEDKD